MVSLITTLVVSLVLLVTSAEATTYYVSTSGNNSNDGLSEATPKQTVAHCVSLMVAGDTCLVMEGDYSEGLIRFGRTGTQASPIRLAAYPGASPKITFIDPEGANFDRILIQNFAGHTVAIGWITIEGLELTNGHDGVKYYNLHNSVFRNNWIHHNRYMGILGNNGGHHNLFERNIFNHNGRFAACAAGTTTLCILDHGIYAHGKSYTIRNNVFYDNIGYGVQQSGSSAAVYSTSVHASTEFAGAQDWVISDNTFAYQYNRGGIVIWGSLCTNARIENNIFYENNVTNRNAAAQGVEFVGSSGATGITIRNNHFYASGSGSTSQYTGTQPSDLVSSGNVVNVSPPAFVNGGSNLLPASPDFRLTASAPVNIALVNEFTNNSTLVVGAYKTVGTPTATITTNKIILTFPMSTAVPIQNLSTAGVSISCPSTVCPGSPVVSSVSRVAGTDSQVEITLSGITSNACLSHADAVTVSYNSAIGSWTGNDNIGPYPGSHQKILSFTSVSVTNNCTGSGPPAGSSSYVNYPMENGSGTTVSDTSGNGLHGTTSGSWVSGHTGYGIKVTGGTTQQTTIPYGSGIDPTTQSMTWVVPVFIATGTTSASNFVFGTEAGTNQRGYIAGTLGTWKVGRQSINTTSAGASNLAVTEGWNHLCVRWDSTTDTVTLYKNGVAGTGGATGSYTSYTLATNFEAPILGSGFPATVTETTYDDVQVFTSLQDCATLYEAWNAPPPPAAGTLDQAAIQFQGVILDTAGNPIVIGPSVQSIEVPAGGGAVILFQVHCTNVSDCDLTAFKLVYSKNGSSTWQQVPNTETADGTWMWGVTTDAHLNNGTRSTRLTGSCTLTTGSTQVTSAQTPSIDLPQDGCVVLGYIVRAGTTQAGNYFDYKLQTEVGLDFTTYTQTAQMRVVNPMSSGIGF